jgi:multiple sugar transport system permease protein
MDAAAGLGPKANKSPRREIKERYFSWLFPGPAVIVLLVMMAFPVLYTLYLSFTSYTPTSAGTVHFVGLANYVKLLTEDERFRNAVWRTLVFTVVGVGTQTVLGVALALIFNREFSGRGFFRTIFLMSMVATPVAIALVWMMILDINSGVLNYLLTQLGAAPIAWLSNRQVVLWSLILVDTWQWTPFIMLIALAGLSALPTEPYESAQIDGASGPQLFWYLTLPMLRPTLMVALMFRSIDALKTFDIIYVITAGGPAYSSETLNLYAYAEGFQYFNMGYASALLALYFLLVMGTSLLFIRLRRAASEAM